MLRILSGTINFGRLPYHPSYKEPRTITLVINVGPCLLLRSPIMCFRAGLFRTQQCLGRSPIMCFHFGALKIWEGFSTIPFKSIYKDLRTRGARGATIEGP